MNYFLDTEFIERGRQYPIEVISVGIVCEDGRELYCISREFKPEHASEWVQQNVLAPLSLDVNTPRMFVEQIVQQIKLFVPEPKPMFWGYYADYDWVVFCQLFGCMIDLPKGWPMHCMDLKQWAEELSNPKLPKQESIEHNALHDARWNREAFWFLKTQDFLRYRAGREFHEALKADSERLDRLEAEVMREPLLLHNFYVPSRVTPRGLGLLGGQRTLRQAIDQAFRREG